MVGHGAALTAREQLALGMAKQKQAETAPAQPIAGKEGAQPLGASQVFHNGITASQLDDLLASGMGDVLADQTEGEPVPDEETSVPTEARESEEPEPPAEPEEQSATEEADPEEEEILADGSEEDAEAQAQPEWMKKRFAKMTRQRRAAEEKAQRLEETNHRLEQALGDLRLELNHVRESGSGSPGVPLSHVMTKESLEDERAAASDAIDWCEKYPEGGVFDGREISAEEVQAIRERANYTLRHGLRKREKWIAENEQFTPEINQAYPWWNDESSPVRAAAEAALKMAPALRELPGFRLLVGDFLLGRHTRTKRLAEIASGAGKVTSAIKRAPSQPSAPSSRPAPVERNVAAKTAALKRLASTGKEADLAALLSIGE